MPWTTVAFQESVDPGAAFNALTAVPDQHVTTVGDDVRVPALNRIIAVAAGVESAAAHRARLVAPSLRRMLNLELAPLNTAAAGAVEPASPQAVVDLRATPVELMVDEELNAEVLSDPVAAQIQWCVVWLADGPVAPITGRIFSTRATGTTTLTASTWTNGSITFAEDLPRGRYQVVGMRAEAAGLVAARLVFPGTGAQGWRPGCLGVDAQADLQHMMFRYGQLGVWGEFESNQPPTVDYLSVSADTAEVLVLDLIQIREGAG